MQFTNSEIVPQRLQWARWWRRLITVECWRVSSRGWPASCWPAPPDLRRAFYECLMARWCHPRNLQHWVRKEDSSHKHTREEGRSSESWRDVKVHLWRQPGRGWQTSPRTRPRPRSDCPCLWRWSGLPPEKEPKRTDAKLWFKKGLARKSGMSVP